jgi:hypothetical protein
MFEELCCYTPSTAKRFSTLFAESAFILVENHSTDSTKAAIRDWCRAKPQARFIPLDGSMRLVRSAPFDSKPRVIFYLSLTCSLRVSVICLYLAVIKGLSQFELNATSRAVTWVGCSNGFGLRSGDTKLVWFGLIFLRQTLEDFKSGIHRYGREGALIYGAHTSSQKRSQCVE